MSALVVKRVEPLEPLKVADQMVASGACTSTSEHPVLREKQRPKRERQRDRMKERKRKRKSKERVHS